jgi:hypothetical protein
MDSTTTAAPIGAADRRSAHRRVGAAAVVTFLALLLLGATRGPAKADTAAPAAAPAPATTQPAQPEQTAPAPPQQTAPPEQTLPDDPGPFLSPRHGGGYGGGGPVPGDGGGFGGGGGVPDDGGGFGGGGGGGASPAPGTGGGLTT